MWRDGLYPGERCRPKSRKYRDDWKRLGDVQDQIERMMRDDRGLLILYEEQQNLVSRLHEMENIEAFKIGFALAVRLLYESAREAVI